MTDDGIEDAITLEEIRSIPGHFEPIDKDIVSERTQGLDDKINQSGATADGYPSFLGLCAAVQDRAIPQFHRPCVALYAAAHGCAPESAQKLPDIIELYMRGEKPINNFCQLLDTDFRVYDLDSEHMSENPLDGEPAMSEEETARATSYGMMAIEEGMDIVYLGTIGQGAAISAQAVLTALGYEIEKDDIIDGDVIAAAKSWAKDSKAQMDALLALQHMGGYDLCALLGGMMAARLAQVPIIIDSWSGLAAAAILKAITPNGEAHIIHCGVPRVAIPGLAVFANQEQNPRFSSGLRSVHLLINAKMLMTAIDPATQSPKVVRLK